MISAFGVEHPDGISKDWKENLGVGPKARAKSKDAWNMRNKKQKAAGIASIPIGGAGGALMAMGGKKTAIGAGLLAGAAGMAVGSRPEEFERKYNPRYKPKGK